MQSFYQTEWNKILRKNRAISEIKKKKITFFFIKCALFELLWLAFSLYLYSRIPEIASIVFCIVIALLIPLIFNPFKTFANDKHGKITSVKCEERIAKSKNSIKGIRTYLAIVIEYTDEKGNIRSIELPKAYEKCFFNGDLILLRDTFEYPFNLTPHDNIVCPFCGNIMPRINKECVECYNKNIYRD